MRNMKKVPAIMVPIGYHINARSRFNNAKFISSQRKNTSNPGSPSCPGIMAVSSTITKRKTWMTTVIKTYHRTRCRKLVDLRFSFTAFHLPVFVKYFLDLLICLFSRSSFTHFQFQYAMLFFFWTVRACAALSTAELLSFVDYNGE